MLNVLELFLLAIAIGYVLGFFITLFHIIMYGERDEDGKSTLLSTRMVIKLFFMWWIVFFI